MNSIAEKSPVMKGYIYVILSAVIFGTMPLMAKFIYADGVNSLSLVLLRNILALPALGIVGILSGNSLKVSFKDIPYISMIALVGCCVTPLLLFSSYNYMDSGTATVFHFIYPGAVVIIEFLFLKKSIKLSTVLSLALCIAGICLFYTPGNPIDLTGSIYAFASGVTYAIYVVLLASFKRKELSGWVLNFYISLVCSVALIAICTITHTLILPSTIKGWGLSFLFALSVNVGAVVLFQNGTRIIGGEKASILSTFEPITSVIVGAIVFGEIIGLRTGVGTVLVVLASILITASDMKKKIDN